MEARKLNFNAPLLSVRRSSAASFFSDRNKDKRIENSPPISRRSPPYCNSDASLDQVTEPVAVPFVWEQIPGKSKGDIVDQHESQPDNGASGTPRLPPGRASGVIKYTVGKDKDTEHQKMVRPQTELYSLNDHVNKLEYSKEGLNEKCISESESDDDFYCDALDTLSPKDSFSMNCSISTLSGLGAPSAKPSGTFYTDPQTRDFMMSRFLPAAKAMTLATPQYFSRKQSKAPEKPAEVKKVIHTERKPPVNQNESIIIPHYNQDLNEEETEDEYDDYGGSGNLSRKACGLLPRLCFNKSLCILNPVPGLKVRANSSMSSIREIVKPGKATYIKSHSHNLEKKARDVVRKIKSNSAVQSPRLLENKSNSAVQSPRLLEHKSKSAAQSPRLSVDRVDIGVQFSRLPEDGKKMTSRSNRFNSSNDLQLQIVDRSSPKRLPGAAKISPYRRERPQSPFRGGGLLGMPKEAEKFKANMLVKYTRNNNNSQELVPYQRSRKASGSQSPAVEKTLYVDTVNFAEIASPSSNSSDTKVQTDPREKHSNTLLVNRMLKEPATLESSIQDIKSQCISGYEITGPVSSGRSSFSDKHDLRGQAEKIHCFRQNGGMDQESNSLQLIKVRADACLPLTDDDYSRASDRAEAKAGSDSSSLPPPLPKTPSESWLCRALPSVTPRNSFSRSYNSTRFDPKKQEPKVHSTHTKWETIVKTSYLHHDHVRYSEELVPHFSHQSKT